MKYNSSILLLILLSFIASGCSGTNSIEATKEQDGIRLRIQIDTARSIVRVSVRNSASGPKNIVDEITGASPHLVHYSGPTAVLVNGAHGKIVRANALLPPDGWWSEIVTRSSAVMLPKDYHILCPGSEISGEFPVADIVASFLSKEDPFGKWKNGKSLKIRAWVCYQGPANKEDEYSKVVVETDWFPARELQ